MPSGTSLEDAAEAFADKFGEDALIGEIQREFSVQKVQPYHQALARVSWKRIYTTNYDNVLERAYSLESKRLTPVTLDLNTYKVPKDQTICVHLNGYVDKLDRETIWTGLKLTEASYLTASIADSPWTILFRQDIRLARAVFFVGFSLNDLDIKRILFESDTLKEKCFFVIGPSADDATQRRASRFGNVLKISVEDFANDVLQKHKTYIPAELDDLSTLSIKEHSAVTRSAPLSDRAFLDLLELGAHNENQISESLSSGRKFYLERSKTDEVFNAIDRGERVIAVCSDLGNGKSLFLEGLRLRALERGFRVFEAKERTEETATELEMIAKLADKVILTIEEYQAWLDEIRLFRLNASDHAVLIVTARNSVHDVVIDDLIDAAGLKSVHETRLDTLNDEEIEWFVEALNEYGLWGEWAGRSKTEKIRYLNRSCNKQIHAILLKLLASPDIGGRLRQLSDDLKQHKEPYQVLLSVFVLTVINQMPTVDILIDIWGTELLGNSSLRKHSVFKQFIDFDRSEIIVRSPIAAEYLLRNIADANTLTSILTTMAKRTDVAAKISPRHRGLFVSLLRFSNLQLILPEEGRRASVIRYYESIKNLDGCKNNPLFWLQYAIACVTINELPRAERYFRTAYSMANDRGMDTFQIDNHFARFLMVQAIENLQPKEAMSNFRSARTIINRQIRDERRHHPYSVATNYQGFFDRFGLALSTSEIDEIGKGATTVLNKILQLPNERRQHRHVRECQKAMRYVIDRAKDIVASKSNGGNETPT